MAAAIGNYRIDKLLMDGTSSIIDAETGTAFTMAGTPTTASLLGATAPKLGASWYSSCKIAPPFAAGSPLTILAVVNVAWTGNDGIIHHIVNNGRWHGDVGSISLRKDNDNNIIWTTNAKSTYRTVNAATFAAGTHVIICTADAAGARQLFLDGVALTNSTGASSREATVGTNLEIGQNSGDPHIFEGAILCAIWGRVLSGTGTTGEIGSLFSLAAWSDLFGLDAAAPKKALTVVRLTPTVTAPTVATVAASKKALAVVPKTPVVVAGTSKTVAASKKALAVTKKTPTVSGAGTVAATKKSLTVVTKTPAVTGLAIVVVTKKSLVVTVQTPVIVAGTSKTVNLSDLGLAENKLSKTGLNR